MKKRLIIRVLLVVLCVVIGVSLVRLAIASYHIYASGYHPASVADFFYRLSDADVLPHFSEQNGERYEVGGYTLCTMQYRSVAGYIPIRAVEMDSMFGLYYRFPQWNYDAMRIKGENGHERSADMYALFLDDGVMIEIISDETYSDNFGKAALTIDYSDNKLGNGKYDQFFWIPNELPEDYLLQCEIDNLAFSYDIIMESYELKND